MMKENTFVIIDLLLTVLIKYIQIKNRSVLIRNSLKATGKHFTFKPNRDPHQGSW